MFIRSPYNYDRDAVSRETGYVAVDGDPMEDVAIQSAKDECDINTIVRRFGVTGQLPQGLAMPTFAVFEEIFDFQSAMNAINEATDSFMALPADVRGRFQNDPHEFVNYASDPKNAEELTRMGLAITKPIVDNTPAPIPVFIQENDDGESNDGSRFAAGAGKRSKATGRPGASSSGEQSGSD